MKSLFVWMSEKWYVSLFFYFSLKLGVGMINNELKGGGEMVQVKLLFVMFSFTFLAIGCAATQVKIPVDMASSQPGTPVSFKGNPVKLLGSPISIGKSLPSVGLVDAMTMNNVDLSKERGSVLLLSIVPSLDTPVCEAQTHDLGEKGNALPLSVKRIVISRDTPFAQKRFANEAKLTNLQYLSDYKQGDFARSTGLLTEGLMLFARSVIVVDKKGIVRYIQVVPEMTHLPDMDKAFQKANELVKEG
jgi:thiol peroxidase